MKVDSPMNEWKMEGKNQKVIVSQRRNDGKSSGFCWSERAKEEEEAEEEGTEEGGGGEEEEGLGL